jgi:hypothetical protein
MLSYEVELPVKLEFIRSSSVARILSSPDQVCGFNLSEKPSRPPLRFLVHAPLAEEFQPALFSHTEMLVSSMPVSMFLNVSQWI